MVNPSNLALINKGSPKWHIQQKVFQTYQLYKELKCTIETLHLLRMDEWIMQVDHLSEVRDTDKWSVDFKTFNSLQKEFGLETDVFADRKNARLPCLFPNIMNKGLFQ